MKKIITLLIFVVPMCAVRAQDKEITYNTADSLASGSVKNIFTSFFQLAFNNLTGEKKQFNFSSNPYAILLKHDPKMAIDYNYKRMKNLQRFNFSFGIGTDANWAFKGFHTGLIYSIIDQRDSTRSKKLFELIKSDPFKLELSKLQNELTKYILSNFKDDLSGRKAFQKERDSFQEGQKSFVQLNKNFKQVLDSILQSNNFTALIAAIKDTPNSNVQEYLTDHYQTSKKAIANALLWTVGIADTTYNDQFFFSNIVVQTVLSKGLTPNKINTIAIEARTAMNLTKDSIQTIRNLNRNFLDFRGGLQWVFRTKDYIPLMDCSLSAKYKHVFSGLYLAEKRDAFYIVGNINIRVLKDIWIPLIIDYDLNTKKTTASINAKINFQTLHSLVQ